MWNYQNCTEQQQAMLSLLGISDETAAHAQALGQELPLKQLRGELGEINLAELFTRWQSRLPPTRFTVKTDHLRNLQDVKMLSVMLVFSPNKAVDAILNSSPLLQTRILTANLRGERGGLGDDQHLLCDALIRWGGGEGLPARPLMRLNAEMTRTLLIGAATDHPRGVHGLYQQWCESLGRALSAQENRPGLRREAVAEAVQLGAELQSVTGLDELDWWPACAGHEPASARLAAQRWLHLQAPEETWIPGHEEMIFPHEQEHQSATDDAGQFRQAYEDVRSGLSTEDDPVWRLTGHGTATQGVVALGIYALRGLNLQDDAGETDLKLSERLARSGLLGNLQKQTGSGAVETLFRTLRDQFSSQKTDLRFGGEIQNMRCLRRNWNDWNSRSLTALGLSLLELLVTAQPSPDLMSTRPDRQAQARRALELWRQTRNLRRAARLHDLSAPTWAVNALMERAPQKKQRGRPVCED